MLKINIQLFADDANPEVETPEVVVQTDNPVPAQEPPKEDIPTFATLDEYNKHVQSISSKAKGELLKEIGFDKVADIKEAISLGQTNKQIADEFDLTKKEVEVLKAQLTEKDKLLAKIDDDKLLQELGIPTEYADIFFTLIDADKSELGRKEKAVSVKTKLLQMFGEAPRFGVDKTPKADQGKVYQDKIKDLQKL